MTFIRVLETWDVTQTPFTVASRNTILERLPPQVAVRRRASLLSGPAALWAATAYWPSNCSTPPCPMDCAVGRIWPVRRLIFSKFLNFIIHLYILEIHPNFQNS
jgi:hypothetical protein